MATSQRSLLHASTIISLGKGNRGLSYRDSMKREEEQMLLGIKSHPQMFSHPQEYFHMCYEMMPGQEAK